MDQQKSVQTMMPLEFNVELFKLPKLPNMPPEFLSAPDELIYYIGDEMIKLPDIFDFEGDKVTVKADLSIGSDLFEYSAAKNALIPLVKITEEMGFPMVFQLTDENKNGSKTVTYFIKLSIKGRKVYKVDPFVP
jgi:hypothetical protein